MLRSYSRYILLTCVLVASAAVWAQPKAQPESGAKGDPHAAARTAIRAAMDSFAQAFEAGDAKALAAHWTTEGEYQNEDGHSLRGRGNLEQAFANLFANSRERSARVTPVSLRFLSDSSAIDEGKVVVRNGPVGARKRTRYEALFVREDGKWRIAMLTEFADNETTLDDLAWLIGQWKSTAGKADIVTTYAWDPNKKFIHVDFKITEQEGLSLHGTQIIGIDPATGGIRSWTFEANGGVGEADWTPDGDHWELSAAGSLPDGRTLTETNVLRKINNDTFTWQSVYRLLDDEPIPDLPPVRVERVK